MPPAELVTLLSLEFKLRRVLRLVHGLYDVFDKGVLGLYSNEAPPPTASEVIYCHYYVSFKKDICALMMLSPLSIMDTIILYRMGTIFYL